MTNEDADPLFSVLLSTAYLSRGIIPIQRGTTENDVNRDMASMPPELQRTAKRKFRKAWRKAAKQQRAATADKGVFTRSSTERYLKVELGLGIPTPDRRHMRARKRAVMAMLREEARAACAELKARMP